MRVTSGSPAPAIPSETLPSTLRELLLYFVHLGTFGFGGPIALAGRMQRDLVEDRRWLLPDLREGARPGLVRAAAAPPADATYSANPLLDEGRIHHPALIAAAEADGVS